MTIATYMTLAGILKIVAILVLSVPVTWFPIQYSRSNWRATTTGKALMYSSLSLAAAVDQSAVLVVLVVSGVTLGATTAIFQAGVFLAMNVTAWYMLSNLRRIQAMNRDAEDRENQSPEQEGSTP